MLYGTILLLLSGIGLWFVESIPWSLRWLRYLSVAVHVIAALTTTGAFIIHVDMGTAMVRGGFSAIVTGDVPASWARHHHRLWYDRVEACDTCGCYIKTVDLTKKHRYVKVQANLLGI